MKQLLARVCHGAGSLHLVVPEDEFKSLGGGRGIVKLLIEVMPEHSHINRNRLHAHEQMARYREILKLKDQGLNPKEIADKLHVSDRFASKVFREFGSFGLDTMRTHLTRFSSDALERVFGIHNPVLADLQKAIEAEPIWRLKMLRHSTHVRVREVESFCQEQGIRVEPGISGNNCAGLTVRSYEKVRALIRAAPKAFDIKALVESESTDLAAVFAKDPDFEKELDAFYDYKAARNWL